MTENLDDLNKKGLVDYAEEKGIDISETKSKKVILAQIAVAENTANDEQRELAQQNTQKIPGRPENINETEKIAEKQAKETKKEASIVFRNTKGQLCRKVFEIFTTPRGVHQRLIRIDKNVSMKDAMK